VDASRTLLHAIFDFDGNPNAPRAYPLGSNILVNNRMVAIATALMARTDGTFGPFNVDAVVRSRDVDGQSPFPLLDFDNALGLAVVNRGLAFNGALWDRVRSASAVNLALLSGQGAQLQRRGGDWSEVGDPGLGAVASATRAAGGVGVRHVCTSITATLAAGATAAGPLKVYLRDGLTGVGPVIFAAALSAPVQGVGVLTLSDLSIVGSANTAMTLEFVAAGPAGSQENVTLQGYSAT